MLLVFVLITALSFNPHTHEGCDGVFSFGYVIKVVSIHTPTKGVTYSLALSVLARAVSIHTPTKGVTVGHTTYGFVQCCFNPHTHEGCDYIDEGNDCPISVSIHTPTKGVTIGCKLEIRVLEFQSTHPRRV